MRDLTIEFEADAVLKAIDDGARTGLAFAADFVVNAAREDAPHRTGALKNSIMAEPVQGSYSSGTLEVSIGAGAPYAAYVEFGTGVFGPEGSPIWIEPVEALALRFPAPGGGGWHFSKGHYIQGSKPQPFLNPAIDENADRIAEKIGDEIELAILKLGD